MAQLGRAATSDDVLLWEHGRRHGLGGDGQSGNPSFLMIDGNVVASNRVKAAGSGTYIKTAAGSNGVGPVTIANVQPGDTVISATDLSATPPADVSSSFEATVTVAGQIQQSSASNLSAHGIMFAVAFRS